MNLHITVLPDQYAVNQLAPDATLPDWLDKGHFYSITTTRKELSLVCKQNDNIPDDIESNRDWRLLRIMGPLDFSLTGIIAGIAVTLAEQNISIFVISTFDTDYFLVKARDLDLTIDTLRSRGYIID